MLRSLRPSKKGFQAHLTILENARLHELEQAELAQGNSKETCTQGREICQSIEARVVSTKGWSD